MYRLFLLDHHRSWGSFPLPPKIVGLPKTVRESSISEKAAPPRPFALSSRIALLAPAIWELWWRLSCDAICWNGCCLLVGCLMLWVAAGDRREGTGSSSQCSMLCTTGYKNTLAFITSTHSRETSHIAAHARNNPGPRLLRFLLCCCHNRVLLGLLGCVAHAKQRMGRLS